MRFQPAHSTCRNLPEDLLASGHARLEHQVCEAWEASTEAAGASGAQRGPLFKACRRPDFQVSGSATTKNKLPSKPPRASTIWLGSQRAGFKGFWNEGSASSASDPAGGGRTTPITNEITMKSFQFWNGGCELMLWQWGLVLLQSHGPSKWIRL